MLKWLLDILQLNRSELDWNLPIIDLYALALGNGIRIEKKQQQQQEKGKAWR